MNVQRWKRTMRLDHLWGWGLFNHGEEESDSEFLRTVWFRCAVPQSLELIMCSVLVAWLTLTLSLGFLFDCREDDEGQGSIQDSLDPLKHLVPCLVKDAMLKLSPFGHIFCSLTLYQFWYRLVLPLCQMVQSLKSHFTYTEVICALKLVVIKYCISEVCK